MPDIEKLELALQKERKAKIQAEHQLEEKERALNESHDVRQHHSSLLQKKNKEFELLLSLVQIGNQNIDITSLVQYYVDAVCKFCNWPIGHAFIVNEKTEKGIELQPSGIWHLDEANKFAEFAKLTDETVFTPGICVPGRVYQSEAALWIDEVFADNDFPRSKIGTELGLKSAFGIPIAHHGKIIYVAEFFSPREEPRNQYLLDILNTTGIQISTILARQRMERRLKKELKSAQKQLIQSAKLASIGSLAGGVAHEINNPIAFVISNTNTLVKYTDKLALVFAKYTELMNKLSLEADVTELVAEIIKLNQQYNVGFILEDLRDLSVDSVDGLQRVEAIVAGLKSFAYIDQTSDGVADINSCLESVLKMLDRKLKPKCEIVCHFTALPKIQGNESQLNQVFTNFISNAEHAIEEKGTITISTIHEDDEILIVFTDNGTGISAENIERLYDPFFTTKEVGKGTGLGLSISYGIVQKHGGDISVESTEGEGTTFTINLPVDGLSD
jgi:signal transduction histidine kinase